MIEIKELRKSYTTGSFVNKALDGVSIVFRDNEFVAVLGPSGSGKTTLLNVLGGLDRADSGDIVINGVSTKNYRSSDWDTYRNHRIGFIFQSYNLIPHQSVLANVELALTLANVSRSERIRRSKAMLEKVGLGDHMNKKPSQLSGGQMQRVAIARALVNDPDIVLADEPTGALDTETGLQVMDLLKEVANDRLVIMVTHNPDLARDYATRVVSFHDGKVVGDSDPIRPGEFVPSASEPSGGSRFSKRRAKKRAEKGKHVAGAETAKAAATGVPPAAAATATAAATAAQGAPAGARHAATPGGAPKAAPAPASGGFAAREGVKKKGKARMGFLTALSLSFRNLMTKKGRTFLTAFAGSIGIIGIAAILALSNGVNAYIADTEEEALTAYPLTITKSSFDLTNLMTGMAGYTTEEEGESGGKTQLIPQNTIMTDMFAKVKNNDLKAFKAFLDEGGDGIWDYVNDIEYSYGITPLVYKADTQDGVVQLNPSYMSSVFSNGLNTSSFFSLGGNGMSSFQEMLEDRTLLESQMEVVKGRWPSNYDEAVVVLSRRGKISDYTLYSLGVLDPKAMEDMTKQALNGEEVEVPDVHVDFSYDDAMNLSFKVVPVSATYQRNDEQGSWTDMSKDEEFMKARIAEGIDIKIVGIVKAREDATTVMLTEGVAYPKELTYHLMQVAGESDIVKQQMDNRDVDVFTGKTFEELQDDQGTEFDLENIFTVDEEAMRNAFSFDTGALSGMANLNLDLSGVGLDPGAMNIDPTQIEVDPDALSSVLDENAMQQIMAGAPKFEMEEFGLGEAALNLSEKQQVQISESSNALASGFMAWIAQNDPETLAQMMQGGEVNTSELFQQYLAETPDATAELMMLTDVVSAGLEEQIGAKIEAAMQAYMAQFTEYMSGQLQQLMIQAAGVMANQMAQSMAAQMALATESLGSTLASTISGQLTSQMSGLADALQNGFSFDADAFANAIQFNMTQEDLTSLLTNYMNADELTYDANLTKLGYASKDNPESVAIYSKDFQAKEDALDIIDGYNDRMAADGDDSDTIQYSDIAGVLMSSVTDIVDTISLVLIAFVSISLVVSSIMIAIVTYISVLERKKEIGVLRAMGASRGNIANVFNAETIIEGFIAGVLAISVVLAASVPVNQIVLETQDVPNVMQLPWDAAAVLIGISVVLTFIAGLIPSQKAAHADPVEALRSE